MEIVFVWDVCLDDWVVDLGWDCDILGGWMIWRLCLAEEGRGE